MKKTSLIVLMFLLSFASKSQSWSALNSGVDANGVFALCTDSTNNLLYVGGQFQSASGIPVYFTASWNGTNWAPLGTGMNNFVYALEIYNGELYAGGIFNFAGGKPIEYLAKWNGSSWDTVSTLINTGVVVLKVHNGALYGLTSNYQIFKWDGTNLTYISGPGWNVYALESYNNDLIAGGTFSNFNYIASWDGTTWSTLGNGFNSYVVSLKSYNGYLYAGGEFTFSGGTPANSIAKWDGSTWNALGSGITGNGYSNVFTIIGNNNIIYAGGNYNYAGGQPANYIAQWNGSNWSTLGSGVNNGVQALAIYQNDLYEGGGSIYAGGILVNYIAKWDLSTGITDNTSKSIVSLFPNPFSNSFLIKGTNVNGKVIISDLTGNEILIQLTSDNETRINTENIASGFYVLHYSDEKRSENMKIVKQ